MNGCPGFVRTAGKLPFIKQHSVTGKPRIANQGGLKLPDCHSQQTYFQYRNTDSAVPRGEGRMETQESGRLGND